MFYMFTLFLFHTSFQKFVTIYLYNAIEMFNTTLTMQGTYSHTRHITSTLKSIQPSSIAVNCTETEWHGFKPVFGANFFLFQFFF